MCVCYSCYLHDFDEFEQQFLSVLSFLLLDDDRAHPSGQEESHDRGQILSEDGEYVVGYERLEYRVTA